MSIENKSLIKKSVYNPNTTEKINEAYVFGGSPSGILNFTKPTNKWALDIWNGMEANTWFPKEVNTTGDNSAYQTLSDDEKRMFNLALAQLIFNDSEQTNNLMDNINPYITDPIINACLARQSYEEANHSKSYAVLAEDLSDITDEIYELHKKDPMLAKKNEAIASMYKELAVEKPTELDIMKAMIANNILEGIVFFGGFVAIWSLGNRMLGTASMIKFIARDEAGTHLPLFGNMFQTSLKQRPYLDTSELKDVAYSYIKKFVEIEIEWTKYITGNKILGFSDETIERYCKYRGNVIAENLGYPLIYNVERSPLQSIEDKYCEFNTTRTNFFEGRVINYSKGSLDLGF